MKVHVTVVTVPTSDTPGTTLVVHFDDKRYIFGHISEGSQRAFVERRARLAKVQDIFLTGRTEWATTGGLVGLLLTIGDSRKVDDQKVGGKPVTLHGGDNLLQTIAATRSFVFRDQLKIKVHEIEEGKTLDNVYEDGNVTVRTLHIRPTNGGPGLVAMKRSADKMDINSHRERIEELKEVVEHMFASQKSFNNRSEVEVSPLVAGEVARGKRSRTFSEDDGRGLSANALRQHTELGKPQNPTHLPTAVPSLVALSYILTTHDHRGIFLPKVAKELGVEPGPKFGLLSNGHSVRSANGRFVHPHEVLEPTIPGTGIAVCDIPEANYIADFVSHREWLDTTVVQAKIGCFFWILGPGIAHDPRLIKFMNRFSGSKHIIASPDICPDSISFGGAAKFATRLHHLDPAFFPRLHCSSKTAKLVPEPAVTAEPGLVFHIKPEWALEIKPLGEVFDPIQAISEDGAGSDFLSNVVQTRQSLSQSPPKMEEFPGSDVEVYTLGTGSSVPSRYRNVTATLVTIPNNCSILFDCGEGTVGQMKRVFGSDEYDNRLFDIQVLYISHLHADHHLGSIAFLKAQQLLLRASGDGNRPTFVVGPHRFWTWLTDYSSVEDFGINRLVFISNEQLRYPAASNFTLSSGYHQLLRSLKLKNWDTAPALHCQSSFTTALTFESGFKLAYSGDTRPTTSFVSIGNGATLLIHEATFDDELIAEAVAKKHSTIGEAIRAGRDMCARKIALVHFSQRYPKAPRFEAADAGDVVYGFDYMRFRVGEVNRFVRLVKGLAEVYNDEARDTD